MKKSAILLAAVGVVAFCGLGVGDLSAAPAKGTAVKQVLGSDLKDLEKTAEKFEKTFVYLLRNNEKKVDSIRESITSGYDKHSIPSGVYITVTFDHFASVLRLLDRKFELERKGCEQFNKARKVNATNEIEAREKLKIAKEIGRSAPLLLKSILFDIAMVGERIEGLSKHPKSKLPYVGAIDKIIADLEANLLGEHLKKSIQWKNIFTGGWILGDPIVRLKYMPALEDLIKTYKSQLDSHIKGTNDAEYISIFKKLKSSADTIGEIFITYIQFIHAVKLYTDIAHPDASKLIEAGKQAAEKLKKMNSGAQADQENSEEESESSEASVAPVTSVNGVIRNKPADDDAKNDRDGLSGEESYAPFMMKAEQ